MNEWLALILGIFLTIGTGLFVASEFALLNLERNELESRAARGEAGLAKPIRALKRTSTHLSAAQLGITLTTLLTGYVAEPALSTLLAPLFEPFDLSKAAREGLALFASMAIATLFSFLIGELVPKNIALSIPLGTLRFVVVFQLAFTWVFAFMIRF